MTYIEYNDLTSEERQGTYIMVDKVDIENKKPMLECRAYAIGWRDSDGKIGVWSAPNCELVAVPFGRYLKTCIKESNPN